LSPAAAAIAHAIASGTAPKDGLVAVKIQYPDALSMMSSDLRNLKTLSAFLSKTEIKFDLVSAVDELQKQIHLEFDFMRWVVAPGVYLGFRRGLVPV
jgi:predicted unusual protein kinase regulating ubiquinone biosynthesis (AarF/ABC1/UbiB family)